MKPKKRLKLSWGDVQGFRPGSGPVSNSVQGANWDSLIKGGPAEKNLLRSLDRSSLRPLRPSMLKRGRRSIRSMLKLRRPSFDRYDAESEGKGGVAGASGIRWARGFGGGAGIGDRAVIINGTKSARRGGSSADSPIIDGELQATGRIRSREGDPPASNKAPARAVTGKDATRRDQFERFTADGKENFPS